MQPPVNVPGFWDPRRRPERPDLSRIKVIRFLTETDYPPFNFSAPDGGPQGFNVDLARIMCEELKTGCTVQMRRFETLIRRSTRTAATRSSPRSRRRRRPAPRSTSPIPITAARPASWRGAIHRSRTSCRRSSRPQGRGGRRHRARGLSQALFTEAELRPYPNSEPGAAGVARNEVDLLFGDAGLARVLAQRHRLGDVARSAAGPISTTATSVRASASPCARATSQCAWR